MKMPSLAEARSLDLAAVLADFKSLDPQDVGGWPLVPRVAVLVLIFVLCVLAAWWFDWREQIDTLGQKEQQELKLKDEFLAKKRQAVNLAEYRKQLGEIDRAFGALLKQLPNKAEMDALIVDINQAGLGRGLKFELFKPGVDTLQDFYAELPIQVRVTGGYHDLGAFVSDVAQLSRIVTVSDLNIEASKDTGVLRLDGVARTYRYLDDEEIARQRREKAEKAKKGAKK